VLTRNGQINLKMADRRADFQMYLTVPAGTAAVVGVPKDRGHYSAISVNQQTFWQAGKSSPRWTALPCLGTDQHYYRFLLVPGRWTIQAKKRPPDVVKEDVENCLEKGRLIVNRRTFLKGVLSYLGTSRRCNRERGRFR
jgi:hypothetical protein